MGRTRYYIYDPSIPHFHTCTVVGWMPIFTRPETTQIILDAFCYMQTHHNVALHAYVILENHLHFIAKAEPAIIQRFKSYTARKIIDYLTVKKVDLILQQLTFYKAHHKTESHYQLWQEGTHPQQIQDAEMMMQKLDYIHYNPVKRGYVDEPVHWRYSSARNYAGEQGMRLLRVGERFVKRSLTGRHSQTEFGNERGLILGCSCCKKQKRIK